MSNIIFFQEEVKVNLISKRKLKTWIFDLIILEDKSLGNVNIIFCTDNYLLEINKKFLKHNYLTDIITFSNVTENRIEGELFISTERVKENAKHLKVSYSDELYRVIFHGILHLVGYNDKTKSEKLRMREKEDFYLDRFVRQNI